MNFYHNFKPKSFIKLINQRINFYSIFLNMNRRKKNNINLYYFLGMVVFIILTFLLYRV